VVLRPLRRDGRAREAAATSRQRSVTGLVFLLSGMGIQQALRTIERLIAQQDPRPILLIDESPSWETITMRDQVEGLLQHLNVQVIHVLKEPPADWTGETGVIELELLVRHLPDDPQRLEYFIGGPAPTRQRLATALQQLGVPGENIHEQ
jgi:predicted ferric reductase